MVGWVWQMVGLVWQPVVVMVGQMRALYYTACVVSQAVASAHPCKWGGGWGGIIYLCIRKLILQFIQIHKSKFRLLIFVIC